MTDEEASPVSGGGTMSDEITLVSELRASVIIPHLNTPQYLMRCLSSIATQELDRGSFEVIVVDNGSSPPTGEQHHYGSRMLPPIDEAIVQSLDEVCAFWPEVRFLLQPEPGPGPARNMGAVAARAPVLVFTDADIRAAPGWLQAAVDAVEDDPSRPVGGDVRIEIRDPRRPTGLEAYSAIFSFRQKMYVERLKFSSGNNLACSRTLFDLVGGFGKIGTPEDKNWCQKASAMGHPPIYCQSMLLFHPAPASIAASRERIRRIMEQHFDDYQAANRPRWHWNLYRWTVLLATVGQVPQMLLSSRIESLGGRLRGLKVLFLLRWQRFIDMGEIGAQTGSRATLRWNR
jgi:glycosyltransferase involved in cell wall biosynthesis